MSVEASSKKFFEHYYPSPAGTENILLKDGLGRVLSEDMVSPIDVPGFDRATMDGYAMRAADSFGAGEETPVTLKIVGESEPGVAPTSDIEEGEVVELATGAPIPKGANAVIMVEYTQPNRKRVELFKPVVPGENIMAAGSDIMQGELVLRKGDSLSPREMGVIAALGQRKISVYRKPTVAIISTGNELTEGGETLDTAMIYDVNATTVSGAVVECGAIPIQFGIVPDSPRKIKQVVSKALRTADLVLTSGSTSAGVSDVLYRVIDDLGYPGMLVHGLSIKPGKPTFLAVLDRKPLIGLPGYPTSALMIFNTVVRPIVLRMAGLREDGLKQSILGTAAQRIHSAKGRREMLPVHLVHTGDHGYQVYPVESGSGAISSMGMSDGFIDISSETQFVEEGEKVRVTLFGSDLRLSDLVIIGSHCVGVDILLQAISTESPKFSAKIINSGSLGGLRAVTRGEADVAGVHLIDADSGEYNHHLLEKQDQIGNFSLIRGYRREQGLIVARHNPLDIREFEDLLRRDVTFMNRNPGSGTRILTDLKLKELSQRLGLSFEGTINKIRGYDLETKSHSAIAAAIHNGKADVGIGIKANALAYGLGFIPLTSEQYDFLIPTEKLSKKPVELFIRILRSQKFADALAKGAPGLSTTRDTGSIVSQPITAKAA